MNQEIALRNYKEESRKFEERVGAVVEMVEKGLTTNYEESFEVIKSAYRLMRNEKSRWVLEQMYLELKK